MAFQAGTCGAWTGPARSRNKAAREQAGRNRPSPAGAGAPQVRQGAGPGAFHAGNPRQAQCQDCRGGPGQETGGTRSGPRWAVNIGPSWPDVVQPVQNGPRPFPGDRGAGRCNLHNGKEGLTDAGGSNRAQRGPCHFSGQAHGRVLAAAYARRWRRGRSTSRRR